MTNFQILKQLCIPGINSAWIQLVNILLSVSVSMFMGDNGLYFLFICHCLNWYQCMLASLNELRHFPTFSTLWESLQKIVYLLTLWQNLPVKQFWPGVFFLGKFDLFVSLFFTTISFFKNRHKAICIICLFLSEHW